MSTEADEVTRDFIEGMGLLSSGVPGGYQERGHGVVLNVIGLDSPSTNTLHVLEPSASRRDAERMVRRVQDARLPFVFRVRPNAPDWVDDLAAASGLTQRLEFPIMRAIPGAPLPRLDVPTIVEVDPSDADLVSRVRDAFTMGNGVPPGVFDPLVAPAMFDRPEVAVYAALDESAGHVRGDPSSGLWRGRGVRGSDATRAPAPWAGRRHHGAHPARWVRCWSAKCVPGRYSHGLPDLRTTGLPHRRNLDVSCAWSGQG